MESEERLREIIIQKQAAAKIIFLITLFFFGRSKGDFGVFTPVLTRSIGGLGFNPNS